MRLHTIGFTKKTAETFFRLLESHHVNLIVDIRLNAAGQLAGFAKSNDLAFFLSRLLNCAYVHIPELAPTGDILGDYRKDQNWGRYVERFEALMDVRNIPQSLDRSLFTQHTSCLLCSESTPDTCHRRLVAERLAAAWSDIEVVHLV